MSNQKNVSAYLSFLLRHKPQDIGLEMDRHGWVSVEALIAGVNSGGKYRITAEQLEQIVAEDNKGRYRFNADRTKIKACQGHSLDWVEPELDHRQPPQVLYHGTTAEAAQKILATGAISKMNRHAVHLQADREKAWQSARRWHRTPVLLEIDAAEMHRQGFVFGVTENGVWCTETVPVQYILRQIADSQTE